MVLLFECYPLLPPVTHKPVYFAVLKLILGLSTNWTTLKAFLSQIGECVEWGGASCMTRYRLHYVRCLFLSLQCTKDS